MSDNGQEKQVLFEIKQLCKSFGPTKVLDHIDATIRQGEVVVIVGRRLRPRCPAGGRRHGLHPLR